MCSVFWELELGKTFVILIWLGINYDDGSFGSVWPNRKRWRWKGGVIPYHINGDTGGFSKNYYEMIEEIINDINSNLKGCIQFKFVIIPVICICIILFCYFYCNCREIDVDNAKITDKYVKIRVPVGSPRCKASIGKKPGANGESYLELSEDICTSRDIYHELLHTLGLLHEHQR